MAGTSPADMTDEEIADEVDDLHDRIEALRDATDSVDLAYRFRLEKRKFDLEDAERRRWKPTPEYDDDGKLKERDRGNVIRDRLSGYGLNDAEAVGLVERVEDLPAAKEGSYSDEEWARISAEAAARESYPPTEEQNIIIEGAARRGLNMAVMALAGTGKSSTLKMLSHRMPGKKIVYLAFNRSVAAEAREAQARGEYAKNLTASTANAYAAKVADKRLNNRLPSNRRNGFKKLSAQQIADRMRWYDTVKAGNRDLSPGGAATVAERMIREWAKSADAEMLPKHITGAKSAQERRDLFNAVKPLADRMWDNLTDPTRGDPDEDLTMDFDYIVKMWALGGYKLDADTLFWDEAQDVNPVMEGVVRGALAQGVQVVAVGDSNQAIYGFRGAADALGKLPVDARATLTQSFRFGPAVADAGNRFLRLLGTRMRLKGFDRKQSRLDTIKPGDETMVIARTNAGVALAAVEALSAGRRVAVSGGVKDLQEFVQAARALANGERTDHAELARFNGMAFDDILEAVKGDPDLQQLKSLFDLLDKHADDIDKLLESGAQRAETENVGGRVWVNLDWNDPKVDQLKRWLGDAKTNGVGKLLYDPATRRYFYEPGKRNVPWKNERSGRSGVHKVDNKLSLEEAQQKIDAHLAKLYPQEDSEGGRLVDEKREHDVLVTTAHKSKGLESERVRIADDFRGPEYNEHGNIKWETIPDDEALRVAYVALTRATDVLDAGSLGWVFQATREDDPTLPPNGDYRRDWVLDEFNVGDRIDFQEEDGTPNVGTVDRIDAPGMYVRYEVDGQEREQWIGPAQVLRLNGQGRPQLPIASDDELDRALAEGRYAPVSTTPAPSADTAPAPSPSADAPEAAAGRRWNVDDWVVTPNGEGRIIASDADEVIVLDGGGAPRTYEPWQLSMPGEARTAEHDAPTAKEAARQEKRQQDLQAAQSPEGLRLFYGSRLANLDLDEGHGQVLDEDGNVAGWVRRRGSVWLGQDARGGTVRGSTAESASDPLHGPREAAHAVDSGLGESHMRLPLQDTSWRHLRPEEGRDEIQYSEFSDAQREQFFKLIKGWEKSSDPELSQAARGWSRGLNHQQMERIAAAFTAAADGVDTSTPEGRREQAVLNRAADKVRAQARRAWLNWQTMPPPGEPDVVGNYDNPDWVPYGHRGEADRLEAPAPAAAGDGADAPAAASRYGGDMVPASEIREGDWVSVDQDDIFGRGPGRIVGKVTGVRVYDGRVTFDVSAKRPKSEKGTFGEHAIVGLGDLVERLPEGNPGREDTSDLARRLEEHEAEQRARRKRVPEGWTAVEDPMSIEMRPGDRFRVRDLPEHGTRGRQMYKEVVVRGSEPVRFDSDGIALWGDELNPSVLFRQHNIVAVPEDRDARSKDQNATEASPQASQGSPEGSDGPGGQQTAPEKQDTDTAASDTTTRLPEGWKAVDGAKWLVVNRGDKLRIEDGKDDQGRPRYRTVEAADFVLHLSRPMGSGQRGPTPGVGDDMPWQIAGERGTWFRQSQIVGIPEDVDDTVHRQVVPFISEMHRQKRDRREDWDLFSPRNVASYFERNEQRPKLSPDISDEPRAELVDVDQLEVGDRVRLVTEYPSGRRVTREGYLLDRPLLGAHARAASLYPGYRLQLGDTPGEEPTDSKHGVTLLLGDKIARLPALDEPDERVDGPEDDDQQAPKGNREEREERREREGGSGGGGEPPNGGDAQQRPGDDESGQDSGRQEDGDQEDREDDDRRRRRNRSGNDRPRPEGAGRGPDLPRPRVPHMPDMDSDAPDDGPDGDAQRDGNGTGQDSDAGRTLDRTAAARRFGSADRMRDLARQAVAVDDLGPAGSYDEVWMDGRLIGHAIHTTGDSWAPYSKFMRADHPNFLEREGAVAELVRLAQEHGELPVDRLVASMPFIGSYVVRMPSEAPGRLDLTPEESERWRALSGLLEDLRAGRPASGNVADAISQAIDELDWVTGRYKPNRDEFWKPGEDVAGLRGLLDTIQPENPRASHHHVSKARAAWKALQALEESGSAGTATPIRDLRPGDVVRVMGKRPSWDLYDTEYSGYLRGTPKRVTRSRDGQKERVWQLRLGATPWDDNPDEERVTPRDEVTVQVPADGTGSLLARAGDVDMPAEDYVARSRATASGPDGAGAGTAGTDGPGAGSVAPEGDSSRVPSTDEMREQYATGEKEIISPEGERVLFGSPERMRELAEEGAAPTPALQADQGEQVWRNGRYIGRLFAPHRFVNADDPEEVWWSQEPWDSRGINFSTREAAIANLVLRDKERGEPDLSVVPERLARGIALYDDGLAFDPDDEFRGYPSLEDDADDMRRYRGLRAHLAQLGRGESPSGNVADDLAHAHDELLWLDSTHYKEPESEQGKGHMVGPGSLARMLGDALNSLRPEDPRATHHQQRQDRAAKQFLDQLKADGGESRAVSVPVGELQPGDIVRLSGRITGLYPGATGDQIGYVVGKPARATITQNGKRTQARRIALSPSPRSQYGVGGSTFLIPADENVRRLMAAGDVRLPLDEHTYGRQLGETSRLDHPNGLDRAPSTSSAPDAGSPEPGQRDARAGGSAASQGGEEIPSGQAPARSEDSPVTGGAAAPSQGGAASRSGDTPARGTDASPTAAGSRSTGSGPQSGERTGAGTGGAPATRPRQSEAPAAGTGADELTAAPEPVGGRPAEWVRVSDIGVGDLVRVDGTTKRGTARTLAGYVVDGPREIQTTQGRKMQGKHRVLISDTPDGAGSPVWVSPDAAAARATRDGNDTTVAEGSPRTGADSDVLTGRISGRVATDGSGNGLFPGSLVTDARGNDGVVVGSNASTVQVRFGDDRTDDVQAPSSLNVTDGGAARPAGWTPDGHRVDVGHVVGDRDGNMLGTVEEVDGDTATVATPDGMTPMPVTGLRVLGGTADPSGQQPKVARMERVTAGDLREGDVMVRDGHPTKITGIERDEETTLIGSDDPDAGETDWQAVPNGTPVDRALDAQGGAPDLSPEDTPKPAEPITSHEPQPHVEPVTGPTVDPQLSPEERDAVTDRSAAATSDPDAEQGTARIGQDLPVTPQQASALADDLREGADPATPEGRAAKRAADRLDAAAGSGGPETDATPEPGTVASVGEGDTIALPSEDNPDEMAAYRVVHIQESAGGMRVLTVEDGDGIRSKRTLASGDALYQLPEPDVEPQAPTPSPAPAADPDDGGMTTEARYLQTGDVIVAPVNGEPARLLVVEATRSEDRKTVDLRLVNADGQFIRQTVAARAPFRPLGDDDSITGGGVADQDDISYQQANELRRGDHLVFGPGTNGSDWFTRRVQSVDVGDDRVTVELEGVAGGPSSTVHFQIMGGALSETVRVAGRERPAAAWFAANQGRLTPEAPAALSAPTPDSAPDTDGPRDPNPAPDWDTVQSNYADAVARAVVDSAIEGTTTPGSIHALRQQIAEKVTTEALRDPLQNLRRDLTAEVDLAGVTGDDRTRLLAGMRRAAAQARTAAVRAAVRTLDDLEPLDGETPEDTAKRAAELLRLIPESLRNRTEPSLNDGDSPSAGRVADEVSSHVSDAVTGALHDLDDGPLTPERRAQIVARLAGQMANSRDAAARRIAGHLPDAQMPGILAALVQIGRRVVELVAAFLKGLAAAAIGAARAVGRFVKGLARRVRSWPETRRLRRAQRSLPRPADGLSLAERMAHWGRLLPAPGRFGQVARRARWYRRADRAALAAGQMPAVQDGMRWTADRAADRGPGVQALRHLAAVRAAGSDVDGEVIARLTAAAPELGDDPHGTVRHARRYAARADARLRDLRAAAAGGTPDLGPEIDAARLEAQHARQEADRLHAAYRAALPEAVRDALAQVREMGPAGRDRLTLSTGSDAEASRALVDASRYVPRDWLADRSAGFLTAVSGDAGGYDVDSGTATVADLGDGGRSTAAHALLAHLQQHYPDLQAAQEAFGFVRTHTGRPGARRSSVDVLLERLFGGDQVVEDEIVARGLAAMFSGDWYRDDDLRAFLMGLLATR
ncbi:UvrD-helicase domain-containing protein [Streptomyces pseudogriseolus]|uniref:UvrD-helicase domain-containing protein n=1 Tax=Streptomyces pseudogriseolus TaxID=36817 RepID=UPI000A38088A